MYLIQFYQEPPPHISPPPTKKQRKPNFIPFVGLAEFKKNLNSLWAIHRSQNNLITKNSMYKNNNIFENAKLTGKDIKYRDVFREKVREWEVVPGKSRKDQGGKGRKKKDKTIVRK